MADRIKAIFTITFLELLRSKILFLLGFFSLMVVALSTFYGSVSIGDQIKIIKDFGIFSVSIFNVLFAVIAGGSLLQKELAKKTIYNVLGKAVYRGEFLLGKFLGITAISAVLILGMGAVLLGYIALFEQKISVALIQAFLFIFLEGIIIAAAAIFFSSIVVTPLLSGLFTLFFFVAGRSAEYILDFAALSGSTLPKVIYWFLPHLNLLYNGNDVVYGVTRSFGNLGFSTLYAVGYAGILLTLSALFFERRHFN